MSILKALISSDRDRAAKLAARAAAAGYELLMLTTDVPVGANRENNLRNGFTLPVRITPRLLLDGAVHPRWSIEVFARTLMKYGIPHLENTDRGDRPSILAGPDRDMRHRRDSVDGEYVRYMRDRWKGRLLVKGTLHPADVEMAVRIGLDGVVVSNHGGRQLDGAMRRSRHCPKSGRLLAGNSRSSPTAAFGAAPTS